MVRASAGVGVAHPSSGDPPHENYHHDQDDGKDGDWDENGEVIRRSGR